MESIWLAVVVCLASVWMIFFAYFGCMRMLESVDDFPKWEKRNHCRVIHKELSIFWRKGWYRVTVEDEAGDQRCCWMRFGLFTGKDSTIWD